MDEIRWPAGVQPNEGPRTQKAETTSRKKTETQEKKTKKEKKNKTNAIGVVGLVQKRNRIKVGTPVVIYRRHTVKGVVAAFWEASRSSKTSSPSDDDAGHGQHPVSVGRRPGTSLSISGVSPCKIARPLRDDPWRGGGPRFFFVFFLFVFFLAAGKCGRHPRRPQTLGRNPHLPGPAGSAGNPVGNWQHPVESIPGIPIDILAITKTLDHFTGIHRLSTSLTESSASEHAEIRGSTVDILVEREGADRNFRLGMEATKRTGTFLESPASLTRIGREFTALVSDFTRFYFPFSGERKVRNFRWWRLSLRAPASLKKCRHYFVGDRRKKKKDTNRREKFPFTYPPTNLWTALPS